MPVNGEFENLPAETDSKIGKFEGEVGKLDQNTMTREANVWWNSLAEGINNKEQLKIKFGDGNATVGFGEMKNRGDGFYIYKNPNNLYWIDTMPQIDCSSLDEKLNVENYIRKNISSITNKNSNNPVLGGTWYVVSIEINPNNNTGTVTYEDGHIQNKASFNYTYEQYSQKIKINKFKVN